MLNQSRLHYPELQKKVMRELQSCFLKMALSQILKMSLARHRCHELDMLITPLLLASWSRLSIVVPLSTSVVCGLGEVGQNNAAKIN
jgi:hypothetical protein